MQKYKSKESNKGWAGRNWKKVAAGVLAGIGVSGAGVYGYQLGHDSGFADGHTQGFDSGFTDGHQQGFDDGFQNGHDAGFSEGNTQGRNEGYDIGYGAGFSDGHVDGLNEGFQEGYDTGHQDGYTEGYDAGYAGGTVDGYHEGYDDGFKDGQSGSTSPPPTPPPEPPTEPPPESPPPELPPVPPPDIDYSITDFQASVDAAYRDGTLTHDEGLGITSIYNGLDAAERGTALTYYGQALYDDAGQATLEESWLFNELKNPTGLYDFKYDISTGYSDSKFTDSEVNAILESYGKVSPDYKDDAFMYYYNSIWSKLPSGIRNDTTSKEYFLYKELSKGI